MKILVAQAAFDQRRNFSFPGQFGRTDAGGPGGSVPATLALTLGPAASFGAFTPGVDKEYTATANVTVRRAA